MYIRFIYLMPSKFVCDIWFYEVLTNKILQADNERE